MTMGETIVRDRRYVKKELSINHLHWLHSNYVFSQPQLQCPPVWVRQTPTGSDRRAFTFQGLPRFHLHISLPFLFKTNFYPF